MARIMALDYGKKRTGIAVTDPLQLIASGLQTVPTSDLLSYLERYLKEETLDCIVVGEPRQMDYSPSEVETDIQVFLNRLTNRFPGLTIARQDERFTSKMAVQAMIQGGMKKKKRQDKAAVDQISATLILQAYLSKKSI
ncbi:Holliday junction resolvase RuvX [Robiginitalea sp.]|nr:Holliday junction resolvase RuvX [Robiginitalea sp.]